MIYFAMGGVAWAIPKTGGTWTAISRVPSLTALRLWPQSDTWGGGGMFKSSEAYWLDLSPETKLSRHPIRIGAKRAWTDVGISNLAVGRLGSNEISLRRARLHPRRFPRTTWLERGPPRMTTGSKPGTEPFSSRSVSLASASSRAGSGDGWELEFMSSLLIDRPAPP
jgi:hypothetical protein